MEAAAVGTPFVATETAGTPAFLPDAGLTTPPIAAAPDAFGNALAVILGNDDLRALLEEQGSVHVACEFCGKHYSFDRIDVEGLFATETLPPSSDTRH